MAKRGRKRNRKKAKYKREKMIVLKGTIDPHIYSIKKILEEEYEKNNAGELADDKGEFISTHAFGFAANYARKVAEDALDLINSGQIANAERYLELIIKQNEDYEHQAKVRYSPQLCF